MKLKTILEAYASISQLIAADRANKFIFASATRIKLAGNLRRLRPLVEDYDEEMQRAISAFKTAQPQPDGNVSLPNKVKDDQGKEIANPEIKLFADKKKELGESDHDFQFSPIKLADLGDNQIPIDTLASLLDCGLVTEEPVKARD